MKKSYLISIQPQWLEKILNGQKTIEVRRKVNKEILDKLDRGETVEAYLYCTKGKPYLSDYYVSLGGDYSLHNDYVEHQIGSKTIKSPYLLNGTIPVKVVIDGYEKIDNEPSYEDCYERYAKQSCMTFEEWYQYFTWSKTGGGYALHISKVEILDKAMKLDEFYTSDYVYERSNYVPEIGNRIISENGKIFATYDIASLSWVVQPKPLQHPPQNMMSVWVK